ncbi:MAG TPA: hypothetical protein VIH28_02930 [Ignavibacteriaceae bacterium]
MELITILSTIILVATISTFILSIGAYILYKIRSRREQKPLLNAVGPTKAELVTVREQEDFDEVRQRVESSKRPRVYFNDFKMEKDETDLKTSNAERKSKIEKVGTPKYRKYTSEGYSSFDKDRSSGDLQWK